MSSLLKLISPAAVILLLHSCSEKTETLTVTESSITESIYASGIIKSENQYSVFAKVNGIVEHVYVESGDEVIKGSPILSIYNEAQIINNENANLTAKFYNFNSNVKKLNELRSQIDIAQLKMKNDSIQFKRQAKLLAENAGTQVEYEGSELAYQASSTNYQSAITQYDEYRRQLDFNSTQAQKNARISGIMAKDYTVYSEIDGKVYNITKLKGEMISVQTELAVIGDANKFVLQMQVDERDILRIKLGQKVIISLDSYGDSTFSAQITKINPIMDIRSKTFLLEAAFDSQPGILYPNMNFEANIIIESRDNAIVIPRNYLIDGHIVIDEKGDSIEVLTGLKNYQQVEILKGLNVGDKIKQLAE